MLDAKEAPAAITGKQIPSEVAQKLRLTMPGNGVSYATGQLRK